MFFMRIYTIKNEKYGVYINKPNHLDLIPNDLYINYGLKENTIFEFRYQDTELFSSKKLFVVSFEGECNKNEFKSRLNDIIENMKKDEIKISYEYILENTGTFIVEKKQKYRVEKQYQRYLIINDKLYKNWWNISEDFKIAYELIKSFKGIDK